MAEKLGLGPEVRELKIGSTFFSNKSAFHTLRYDFKPASVLSASNATIEIGPNQQVTVTHLETSGAAQTIFKGSRRPYQKECVLIIDRNTGEITLEKLSTNIQLKKTRQEVPRSSGYVGRPPTPVEKKHSPPEQTSSSRAAGGSRGRKAACSVPSSKHSPKQQHHSSPQYPHRNSPLIIHKSPPQVSNLSLSPSPAAGSMPMIDDCNDNSSSSFDIGNPLAFPELKSSPEFANFQEDDGGLTTQVGVLSDSSSESSSDSNSSDSDSDNNTTAAVRRCSPPKQVNGHVNGKSTSVPNHFLTEDLQLSESGSDSD